jgi:4-amino-4-deoxy-L-arabinose transferase-like glycosyltransferase
MRTAVVLSLFTILFVILTVSSYTKKSATWDEPHHLAAGYAALKLGDYRLDPENPPLLRKWVALPLLFTDGVKLDTSSRLWRDGPQLAFSHRFLYVDNDADRLLYRARFMNVLLGVVLGIVLFAWARELFGFAVAVIVLALYSFEPNILAHSRLTTTDVAVTLGYLGVAYFLWRTTRRLTLGNLAGLAIFFALAQVVKFSAVLLGPIVALLLFVPIVRRRPWPYSFRSPGQIKTRSRRTLVAACTLVLLVAAAYLAVWSAYGFRHATTAGAERAVMEYEKDSRMQRVAPQLRAVMNWADQSHLLPEAYAQGFLLGRGKAARRNAFLLGRHSDEGWWYYFPLAFAIKTPLSVLLLFLLGSVLALVGAWRRRSFSFKSFDRTDAEARAPAIVEENERDTSANATANDHRTGLPGNAGWFVVLPATVYFILAMSSHLNIGVRHVLPVYPFVFLLAGAGVAFLMRGRLRLVLAGLGVLLLVEFAVVYPDYLAAFNVAVGGPAKGHNYFAASNIDWGQDLKGLQRWMKANDVDEINLAYHGMADPEYYGMRCTYLPGSPSFTRDRLANPKLPGWVALSVTNLHGVYFPERARAAYKPLLERVPDAVIGHSIHVYRVDEPWW